jgi:hypothetical protein
LEVKNSPKNVEPIFGFWKVHTTFHTTTTKKVADFPILENVLSPDDSTKPMQNASGA